MLWSKYRLTTRRNPQLQQRQSKTTSTRTISSSQLTLLKKQSKFFSNCILFCRNKDSHSKNGLPTTIRTEEFPEDLRSISNTKQLEVEPSKVGLCLLGHQWTVGEDCLQFCRSTSKQAETLINQRKALSLVSSVYDPHVLFALFSVQMRQLVRWGEEHLNKKWAALRQFIAT